MPYPQDPAELWKRQTLGVPPEDTSPWFPPTSPAGKAIEAVNPFSWGRKAKKGLEDFSTFLTTPEQEPNLAEPRMADWPAATSYPAIGDVGGFPTPEKSSGLPSAYDPTEKAGGRGFFNDPNWKPTYGGEALNQPGALEGLYAAQTQDEPYTPGGGMGGPKVDISDTDMGGGTGGFGIPTTVQGVKGGYGNMEELMRLANAAPGTTAPGAKEYWQGELEDRLEPEDYQKLQDRKQLEAIMAGLTAAHPAVRAEAEAEARRKAMPQAAYGQAQLMGQQIQAAGSVEEAKLKQMSDWNNMVGDIIQSIHAKMGQIGRGTQGTTEEGQRQLAEAQKAIESLQGLIFVPGE